MATTWGMGKMMWAIFFATLCGPLLAVQAQKWIERYRDSEGRKLWIFTQLMSTRQARLSAEHVQALNLIDISFYGRGPKSRSKKHEDVLEKWREYHHHLSNRPEDLPVEVWVEKGNEVFTDLLAAMATATHFKFDRVQLKSSSYSPVAFSDREANQKKLMESTLSVLSGQTALRMEVVGFPFDREATEAHKEVLVKLGNALTADGLKISKV